VPVELLRTPSARRSHIGPVSDASPLSGFTVAQNTAPFKKAVRLPVHDTLSTEVRRVTLAWRAAVGYWPEVLAARLRDAQPFKQCFGNKLFIAGHVRVRSPLFFISKKGRGEPRGSMTCTVGDMKMFPSCKSPVPLFSIRELFVCIVQTAGTRVSCARAVGLCALLTKSARERTGSF